MGYKTTLCDVSLDGGHYGIAAPAVDFKPGLPAYLRITDINDDGTLNPSDRKSVDDSSAGNYLLHEGDIVFARTGNSTGRNYYYDPRDGEYAYAGFLIKFSLDPRKINPRYMKYYAQSKQYWDWVSSFNTGSTRGNINAKTYASMPIDLLSRQIQDGIVAICDAIDDKIRINRQLNEGQVEMKVDDDAHSIVPGSTSAYVQKNSVTTSGSSDNLLQQLLRLVTVQGCLLALCTLRRYSSSPDDRHDAD